MKSKRKSLLVNLSIILAVMILGFAMTGAYDPACSGSTEGVFTSAASASFVCGHQTPITVKVELRLDTLQQLYGVYGTNYSSAAITISTPVSGVSIGSTSRTNESDATNILGPLNKTYTLSADVTVDSDKAAGTYTIPLSFTIHNKETDTDFHITQSFSLTLTKDNQAAPSAPAVQSTTSDSITLIPITGAEYKMGSGSWQDSNAFTGLSVYTKYTFYARMKETDTLNASPSSPGTAQRTNKLDQAAPAAPTVLSKTSDTVTLNPIAGAEYRIKGSSWQDNNVFTGLTPGTTYVFQARLKATSTYYASPASPDTSVKTDKLDQAAPAAPSVSSKTSDTVTLNPIAGAQYRIKGSPWQDSNVFTGLSPATTYIFQARLKGTSTYNASPASTGTSVTTDKADQAAPAAPTVSSKTADTVTLNPIAGAEYSSDGTIWQDSNVFTGLSPATSYTFYARLKETATQFASPSSVGTDETTDKADQTAPVAPTISSATSDTVTLNIIAGAEYSLDGTTWQDSNVFTGLSPATDYTFYARLKETAIQYASPSSTGTPVTTDKADQAAPIAPVIASKTTDSVTLTPVVGAEYSKDGVTWQDSNIFTGLSSDTEYTFYVRLKGTATQNASPASTGTVVTTDVVIADEEAPTASAPGTGDSSAPFAQLALLALASAALIVSGKKAFGKK